MSKKVRNALFVDDTLLVVDASMWCWYVSHPVLMRAVNAWLTSLACCDFPNSDICSNFMSTCSLWRWWTYSLAVAAVLSFQPVCFVGEKEASVRWPWGWKRNTFATLPTISEHTTLTPSLRSLVFLQKLVKSSSQRAWAECQWEPENVLRNPQSWQNSD